MCEAPFLFLVLFSFAGVILDAPLSDAMRAFDRMEANHLGGGPVGRGHSKKAKRIPHRKPQHPSVVGRVSLTEHSAYICTDEGDYKIQGRGKREVMEGDIVAFSVMSGPRGDRRARVASVVEHATDSIVGTYDVAGPLGTIRPLDSRLHADFFILPEDTSAARLDVETGDVCVARILAYPDHMESGQVTIERKIGALDAPDVGVQYVMSRYGLTDSYPEQALHEAEGLSLDVEGALKDPLRRDIRDRFLITIDPIDARDFDDAISIERTADGGYALGVHIADVSNYVAWDSHIDIEARRRSTSVYLADRVLPMLPERLSNDLCSLVPDRDRLAFTVDIELSATGEVRSFTPYPSVIRSRVRADYEAADALLGHAGVIADPDEGIDEDALARGLACAEAAAAAGRDLTEFLSSANELAGLRQRLRRARGSVDFDTAEMHVLLGPDGLPERIVPRHRTHATGLIEEAMLLANECVAQKLADLDIEAAFRVHEPPSPDSLHAAASTLTELGIVSNEEALGIGAGNQDTMQRVLDRTHGTPSAPLVNTLLLRAMQRALYKPKNEGHYALGAHAYCHFTSPIRRYPDLIVHRALKLQLAFEQGGPTLARRVAPRLVGEGRTSMMRMLPQLCRDASDRERSADSAASATQKIKVAQYYEDHLGERETGTISWVTSMGLFVRLDSTQVEGLVPIKSLGHEWFDLDEAELALTGADTGTRYELGQRVIVEIASVNTVRGHLDFALVHAMDA